jgi:hypothetical protein
LSVAIGFDDAAYSELGRELSIATIGGSCRYPADRVPLCTAFKIRQGAGRASTRCHMPYSSGPCLPTEMGCGTTTCPMDQDPVLTAEMGFGADMCPEALDLRLPDEVGSSAAMCPEAPNLVTLLGRVPVPPRVLRLRTHFPV